MTSGGVNIAPITNAPTITYGRISFSFSIETTPTRTSTITATGTSKVIPNATKVVSANDRYLSMSVIHATPSGAIDAMNLNTTGNTRKYANDIPITKSAELATTRGATKRFSCAYRHGATNAHPWYSTEGSAMTKATRKATFTGTRKTPTTSVAIIWPPAGSAAIRGWASMA